MGSKTKALFTTRRCCVFHRQSSTYGSWEIRSGLLQFFSVATPGLTSVVKPALVLKGEPAKRSGFSHAMMPAQLFTKRLPAMRR